MRQLTQFDEEATARKLCDFMLAEGIEARVDTNVRGGFSLWILDEEHLDDARGLLELYERDPESPRVVDRLEEVRRRRREQALDEAETIRRVAAIHRAQILASQVRRAGPVTHFMIFASVGFAVMALFFTDGQPDRLYAQLSATPESLRAGELWRLFTPAFVKLGLPHPLAIFGLLLGVFWIRTLGAPVERLHGSAAFAAAMLVSAGVSTGVELVSYGASVGGATGSAATLFAYLWLRGRLDPAMPVRLRGDVALWIVAWMVLGLSGPGGTELAARWIVGLAVGVAWALLVSFRSRRKA